MCRRLVFLIVFCTTLSGCSQELPLEVDNDEGFHLKEISLTEAIERQPRLNNCGGRAGLVEKTAYLEDAAKVKYPQFKGSEPLFGLAKFGRDFLKSDKEIKYFFALDASGADGYDTLYFDANHDLDLTNDPPLRLAKNPWPAGLKPHLAPNGRLMFEELAVPIDFGPGYGVRPVTFLPVFIKSAATMHFVPLSFYAGRIKIADHEFDALLGQEMIGVNGRFDGHVFFLHIMEPGKKQQLEAFGMDEPGAYRFVDGKYYTIIATPIGDKLIVKPYTGELGILKIRPGPRDVKHFSAEGSITSPTAAVPIGKTEAGKPLELQPVTEWQVPVGDYTPYSLTLHYDALSIEIGYNFHSDGHLYNRRERPRMFPIQIRKDKPFVLDLANKPEIYFPCPEKDAVYKPGNEVRVIAILIDPVLDIMIRGLEDSRQTINRSLDPVVTIADSRGKTVAEGTMPFG